MQNTNGNGHHQNNGTNNSNNNHVAALNDKKCPAALLQVEF
jgi:hypothetical protein